MQKHWGSALPNKPLAQADQHWWHLFNHLLCHNTYKVQHTLGKPYVAPEETGLDNNCLAET